MEFYLDKNSPVSVINQIQEQIKLSIAMGVLKRGDILPTIREVERQTGINRGQVHRAYLSLHKSGLLSPTPGKRIAVAVSAAASDSVNKKCQELTREILQQIRKIEVSPIAFVRYLSRQVREEERRFPFIAYVDSDKERALRRAEQVSRLWQAPIVGLSLDEFRASPVHGGRLRKVLVNHLAVDSVRRVSRGKRMEIIPIEISYTEETIRALKKIRASSILVLLPVHAISSAQFIVEQLRIWIQRKDVHISWMGVDEPTDFRNLLNDSQYDRILVSPGAQNKVPKTLHRNSRILLLEMELDRESLEIARIRAGVII